MIHIINHHRGTSYFHLVVVCCLVVISPLFYSLDTLLCASLTFCSDRFLFLSHFCCASTGTIFGITTIQIQNVFWGLHKISHSYNNLFLTSNNVTSITYKTLLLYTSLSLFITHITNYIFPYLVSGNTKLQLQLFLSVYLLYSMLEFKVIYTLQLLYWKILYLSIYFPLSVSFLFSYGFCFAL